MADVQQTYRFKFEFDRKDIKKQLKDISVDVKDAIAQMGDASDKVVIFKDLVSYLSNVDKALDAFKTKHKNEFKNLFGTPDTDLTNLLETIFGTTQKAAQGFATLKDKIAEAASGNADLKKLRGIAGEINELFVSVGKAPQIDIDEMFTGKGSKKAGTDFASRIDLLNSALDEFGETYSGIQDKLRNGFGGGGIGSNIADNIRNDANNIKQQVDILEKNLKKYKDLQDKLADIGWARETLLGDSGLDEVFKAKYTIESIQQLIKQFEEAEDAKKAFDESGNKSSVEYYENIVKMMDAAIKLQDIDYNLSAELEKSLGKTKNENGKGTLLSKYEKIVGQSGKFVEEFNDNMMQNMQDNIAIAIGGIKKEMASLSEYIPGSNITGNMVSELEYVKALAGQLKNMFATMSRRADFEYNISVNGLDITALKGDEEQITHATQVESYLDSLFSSSTVFGHSHRGGASAYNTSDMISYLDAYQDALQSFSFVVGGEGIQTLDLSKIDTKYIDKIKQEIKALGKASNAPLRVDEINKIVEKITGVKDVLRDWDVSQIDELAQYMYNVTQNTSAALSPMEKFQSILNNFFGAGKVDASKYQGLMSELNADNAKQIFNQIAKMENLSPVGNSITLTMGQVSENIDQNIKKYQDLREEANLTYDDIIQEVSKVMSHFKNGGGALSNLDFFKQYFPDGEWQEIHGLLLNAYDGLISIEEVQNRIADKFGVNPDTFAAIPTGSGQAAGLSIEQAKTQLQEFLKLANEIQEGSFAHYTSESNVELGKYAERLEVAKSALDKLGEQGLLTAEELEQVENAFFKSKSHLDSYTVYYDGYGSGYGDYYYTYAEEYHAAESEKERLENDLKIVEDEYKFEKEENERLKQELAEERAKQSSQGSAMSDEELEDIRRENGALEEKLNLLLEISQQYGSTITQKKRDRYEELNQKEMNDGLSGREEERMSELFDEIVEADEALEEFGKTYEKITLKLANGKKVDILPDDAGLRKLDKFFDHTSGDDYDGVEIEDIVFVRKQEQAVIQQNNQELQEQLSLQKQINSEERTQEYDVDGDIAKVNQLLEKEKLTYEDILALVKEYNNEAKYKVFSDVGDWDTSNKIFDSHTDIARKLVPLSMSGIGSDSPDKWLSMVGISAEEAAQKLYELYNRFHGIDDLSDELDLSLDMEDTSEKSILSEVNHLDNLLIKINEVKDAVNLKTQEFRDEGDVVGQVVVEEISALNQLQDLLETIQGIVSQINLAKALNTEDVVMPAELTNTSTENPHYVTDPQGNPITMYRGIHGAYGGLVSNRYHGGTFSTSDLEVAKTYAGVLGKIEKVLLSMKNPLEIDGNGKLWKNLDYIGDNADEASQKLHALQGEIKALDQEIEKLKTVTPTEKELKDIQRGMITETKAQAGLREALSKREEKQSEVDAIYADASNPYGIKTTNEIVEIAKSAGYDGVIFKDIVDSANKNVQQASTVMVTFTQDQIHYLETISATFEETINSFKMQFDDLAKYVNTTDNEVKEAVTQLVDLKQKLNVGKITNDEYEALLSKNSLVKDVDKLADKSGVIPDWMETAVQNSDQISIDHIVNGINSFITQMREKLQKIATTFDKTDVSLDKLIDVKTSDADVTDTESFSKTSLDNGYALDKTVVTTNGILNNILQILSNGSSFSQLVEPLSNAVAELKNVASGIIEHQKAQQTDKSAASARIANNYGQLSSITGNTLSGMGDNIQIENMKALADNIVRVRGAVQDVDGVWKGFIIDINESNDAVINAIDEQSVFAKSLNETAEAAKKAAVETENSTKTVDQFTEQYKKKGQERELQKIAGQVNLEKGSLGFDFYSRGLNEEQKEIVAVYDTLVAEMDKYEIAVKNGQQAELDGIERTKKALFDKIDAYKEAHNIVNAGKAGSKKAPGATVVKNATTKYNALKNAASIEELQGSDVVQQSLAQYAAAYEKLINLQKEYKVGQVLDSKQEQEFNDARVACSNYAKELEKLLKTHQKSKDSAAAHYELGGDFVDNDAGKKKALQDFLEMTYGADATFKKFDDGFNKIIYTVNNGDGTFTEMTATINNTRTAIDAVAGEAKEATSVFASFWKELKGKFGSILSYTMASLSIHDVIRVVKQGVQYVREIDLALTELKKVTNETEETYQNFLHTASKTAGEVGSTVADFTNATADFARLGYNIEQAASLAKAASVYKNVGDGIDDVATASESIISTMKAYGIEAENAMGIVDRFNEVGNNFAISSTGIGEAMQRSASALYEAGNTIDESIALITGANSVIQNPEQVGTALKTLALRLRGAKVELEEAGLETDNMAESTSTLQEKLKALTHGKVDIMLDADTFKSTTQILREMSQAWEDMTDIERASALELMGGKRQANILSSLIKNFDTVEDVIKTSADSSGSALKENEKYLDSIQGKMDQFNNTLQTFWSETLNSKLIKGVVELGTNILKLVTDIGLFPTALAGVLFYFTAIKKNNPVTMFKELSTSMHNYGQALNQIKAIQSLNGANGSAKMDTTAFNDQHIKAYGMAVEGLTQKQQVAALATAGLTKEQIAQAIGVKDLTDANFQAALAEAQVTNSKKKHITVSGALLLANKKDLGVKLSQNAQNFLLKHSEEEITDALIKEGRARDGLSKRDVRDIKTKRALTQENMKQASSWKGLTSSIGQLIKQNPVMFFTMLSTVITALISKIETATDRTEKLTEAYNELQSSISELEGNINSLDSELSTIQDKIDELNNKDSLSLADAEQLNLLKQQSAELERQKELQEHLLKAREKQNQVKSLSMVNNLIETTNANQKKSIETWKTVGTIAGSVASIIAGIALFFVDGVAPVTDAAGVGVIAKSVGTITKAVKGIKAAATALSTTQKLMGIGAMASAGGALGGAAGEMVTDKVTAADSLIEWYDRYEKAISEAQQKADEAEAKYLSNMSDKNYDKWQKKVEAVNTLQTDMYNSLEEMQKYISDLEYNDETAGIIDGYNALMTHLDTKANGNSIDSQISSIKSLQSEYESLSKGVDANGNNIALSAEEYARYCSIVEQVLGYAPNLIQSYNDEGEAIFNRNSLIQDSIDLLQEQQRLSAISLVNDDSILSVYDSSRKNYEDQKEIKLDKNISGDFLSGLETLIGKEQSFGQSDESYILENIDAIRQKWSEIIELARQTKGEEFAAAFRDNLQDIFTQLNYAEGAMSQFQQTLFIVPQTSEYYNDLSGEHLNFIGNYIKTFDNLEDLTEDEVLQIRNSIFALTETIGSSEVAQELINSLFEVDTSLPINQYVNSINNILSQLVDQGIIDENAKEKIFAQFIPDAENIDVMLEAIGGKLSEGADKLQGLSLSELKIAYKVVADVEPGSITFTELKDKIDELSVQANTISVPTLSKLLETTDSLNDIESQTSEIVINNTKVTQEYKDALIELVGSEEKVNEYFDKNNSLIVKDAKGLNNLVKATKKNTAASAKLAKTQARLQYYELYKEIKQLTNGQKVTNKATLNHINSLYQEMNALEKTITRYSVLEEQLLGAANAYEKFEQSQEIDAQTDYITSAEEMALALGEAFNTAELGTETAQTAIAGLVPESVYEDLDTVDEKMSAIYDYFKNGKIAQYFTLEYDDDGSITSAEMKLGNLRKFIEDGLANGAFEGVDWQHFDLSEDITSLEDFADQMGVTKEVAFAFLESLEDHDIEWLNGDYTSLLEKLLPPSLENDIYKNTSALAELEIQLANGEITAEEYATTLSKLTSEEEALADRARENTAAWYDKTEQLETYKNQLQEYYKQLETGVDSDGNVIDTEQVKQNISEVTNNIDTLSAELEKLEEPTELTLQIALEDTQEELDALEKTLQEKEIDINANITWDNENKEWNVSSDSEFKEDKDLQQYVGLLNDQINLESLLDDGIVSVDEHLSNIEEILQGIYELQGGEKQDSEKAQEGPSKTFSDVKEVVSGKIDDFKLKAQELFNTTLPNAWDEFWGNVSTFFDGVGEKANELKEKLSKFFTETIPEKWDEFWNGVGEFFAEVAQEANILREKVTAFFTETVPQKWDEFWDNVDTFFTESLPYAIGYAVGAVAKFFTETVPQKWDEFWTKAGEAWNGVQEWAQMAKDKVVEFFTETIPAKWSEFWTNVGTFIDETLMPALQSFANTISSFFTETIPAKWSEFWTGVGNFITDTLIPALQAAKDKIVEFFLTTIPAKWDELWNNVGTFLTETVPQALENVKEGITTFFTVTLPGEINSLWGSIKSWIVEKATAFWDNLTAGFSAGKNGGSEGGNESGSVGVNGTAHAKGTAHKSGNWGLPKSEHDSLVGELGPEIVVDPQSGRYYTVGDNGAEMVDLPKGAIIFNHKQTEGLLKNGYVTSRGKAYAEGNAHVTIWPTGSSQSQWDGTGYSGPDDSTWSDLADTSSDLSDAASDLSDAADEFNETFDWIEVRIEELDEVLGLLGARLENAVGAEEQNSIIDEMIDVNRAKKSNLGAAIEEYSTYASKLLNEIPEQYREAAQNGAIAIEEFTGEADEKTLEAIQNYREWAQKVAETTQQFEELNTEIAELAKQKFDNVAQGFDNILGVTGRHVEQYEAMVDYTEESGNIAAPEYYEAMWSEAKKDKMVYEAKRDGLQKTLDEAVAAGEIEVYSDEWYEMVDAIYEADLAAKDATLSMEECQNAINEIYWDNFDELINRIGYLKGETQNLIDLMGHEDLVATPETDDGWSAGDVEWTDEGMASLGLYTQQMEMAQYEAEQYAQAIDDLNKDYADGKYSESEYLEKLDELTTGQYDSIEAYYEARDAIVDCHKARVDAIKEGIEKEIDAYEELINKKKEELDAEKDLYDFQKKVAESSKNIADIQRKLAALAGDNSASAIAQRKKLEAELAEAKADQEDMYYERSIDNQHDALDKELEDFKEQKEAEIEMWEDYLENVELLVSDSLELVQANASDIYDTLTMKAEEFNVDISAAILTPWQDGENAVADYQDSFGSLVSSTTEQLDLVKAKWQEVIDKMVEAAGIEIDKQREENAGITDARYEPPASTPPADTSNNSDNNTSTPSLAYGSTVTVKKSATHFSSKSNNLRMASFVPGGSYTVYQTSGDQVLIGRDGVYTGWVKKTDIEGFAKGTTGVDEDQWAWLDELGEELVLHAGPDGRLQYLSKGTAVLTHDLTERLMDLAMNPQEVLDRSRPQIAPSKSVVNNNMEIHIDASVGELIHVDRLDGNNLDEINKFVDKAWDKKMQGLNNSLKKFVR